MKLPSIQGHLLTWVLGTLCLGGPLLVFAGYLITLAEIEEVLDDSLRQTALLLADRDLAQAPGAPSERAPEPRDAQSSHDADDDTESRLLTIARRPDGTLLFSSQPGLTIEFDPRSGASVQRANGERWHVYTVIRPDRTIQVAQPEAVRNDAAVETASQLIVPLATLFALIAALMLVALRRGLRPLRIATHDLAQRSAHSLDPLDLHGVPRELAPLVRALNDLLARLSTAFAQQRDFVADAAHELRTPVTALQLQLQLLERSADPAERAQTMQELAAGIARTARLIRQLLSLSRATTDEDAGLAFEYARLDLGVLAREAVARWSSDAERRQIDLGAEVRGAAWVHADAVHLGILLGNLIENALRYTPAGGVVDVVAEILDGRPTLRVIDNGPGIAEADRVRVFDRFYRSPEAVTRDASGSGLGLAIVKAIADKHRAQVSLHEGHAGFGVEVRVAFPAVA